MDERQRVRLRGLVAELTGSGRNPTGLPRHKTGLVVTGFRCWPSNNIAVIRCQIRLRHLWAGPA